MRKKNGGGIKNKAAEKSCKGKCRFKGALSHFRILLSILLIS